VPVVNAIWHYFFGVFMDQWKFIEAVAPAAREGHRNYGVPASLTIAQAILESGWGKYANGNNLFGIKWREGDGYDFVKVATTEYYSSLPNTPDLISYEKLPSGQYKVRIYAKFRKYVSWADSIRDHTQFLLKDRYKLVRESKNYVDACVAVQQCGYATDPEYASRLIALIEQYDLDDYDCERRCDMVLAIDDGHGMDTAGKRTPKYEDGSSIHENEFNRACAEFLRQAAIRCGITPVMCAPGDADHSLANRVAVANNAKADVFVSIHYNAQDDQWGGVAGGVETWYYKTSTKGQRLATLIQQELVKGTKQVNRGVKAGNFYVTRKTSMPAVLVECGFMDYRPEADLMIKESFQRETAEDICRGVCAFLGVTYIPPGEDDEVSDGIKEENKRLRQQIEEYKKQVAALKKIIDEAKKILVY
jgi:N-acetylmuramoyl-L-alanine amidase